MSLSCLSMSKIQNLKANHNITTYRAYPRRLFVDVKDTKSESKSQRLFASFGAVSVVCRCQRYKIWKQITTGPNWWIWFAKLFVDVKDTKSESKSQHNVTELFAGIVVCRCQRYKIWKQITTYIYFQPWQMRLFVDVKDTKSESKSQRCILFMPSVFRCLSMSKIQNLKANHNWWRCAAPRW